MVTIPLGLSAQGAFGQIISASGRRKFTPAVASQLGSMQTVLMRSDVPSTTAEAFTKFTLKEKIRRKMEERII